MRDKMIPGHSGFGWPNFGSSKKKMSKNQPHTRIDNATPIQSIIQYTFPELRINKCGWYIEFYAYDETLEKLRRKRIKVNCIKPAKARRQYANGIIARLAVQLQTGWNPWKKQFKEKLLLFSDIVDYYIKHIERAYQQNLYRQTTYDNYKSMIRRFIAYNNTRQQPIKYIKQLDKQFCVDFLDDVYIKQGLSAQYRNNCLIFLKTFCRWCQTRDYMDSNPATGIPALNYRVCAKKRTSIPADILKDIRDYLNNHDRYFLLSAYLLYYCCVRPTEQVQLKLTDFDLKNCTLTIPDSVSKNHNTQTVTLPIKVIHLMIDLDIFSNPSDYYLFSTGLRPGNKSISRRMLGKHWDRLRTALKLRDEYQFYSLKDTGITDMLKHKISNISVRDQARHSSLSITNIYARAINNEADKDILQIDGDF